MTKRGKSYWSGVCCSTDRDKMALRSWFNGLIDDCDILKADSLADSETDQDKKLRLHVRFPSGIEKIVERSFGAREFRISFKPLSASHPRSNPDAG